MFDVPDAKRVRRDDVYSPSLSPSSRDPTLGQVFLKSLVGGFIETVPAPIHVAEEERREGEEIEFRLFARSTNDKTPTRIRIQSPSIDDQPAGLINPGRPREYYFCDSLSKEGEHRLKTAAVSGEHVLGQAHTKWPGCSLPWRVMTILSTGTPAPCQPAQSDTGQRKTRKGKKTRILIRRKAVEEHERKAKAEEDAADKQLAERAKRAKRNRDKKLKKRERDKVKKAAARAPSENGAESSDADDPE